MLTRSLNLSIEGFNAASTPLLIPSFSSRAATPLPIEETIDLFSEFITDVSLISAYDINQSGDDFPKIETQNLIFIDSGGYECSINNDLTDIGYFKLPAKEWNAKNHIETVNAFSSPVPLVLISYDHPQERCSIDEQIRSAIDLFDGRTDALKEILLKSPTIFPIDIEKILQVFESLHQFDIMGVTEKELGASVFECMKNIARLRLEMKDRGLEIPIHIFGSLDPITSPLYYLSGADIFDGLSWLRHSFGEGEVYYINSKGTEKKGIEMDRTMIWAETCRDNYYSLKELEKKLRQVQRTQNLGALGYKSDFFETAYEKLSSELGDVI